MKVTLWKELNDQQAEKVYGGFPPGQVGLPEFLHDIHESGLKPSEAAQIEFGTKNLGQYNKIVAQYR
jgi:hypothetical protein